MTHKVVTDRFVAKFTVIGEATVALEIWRYGKLVASAVLEIEEARARWRRYAAIGYI